MTFNEQCDRLWETRFGWMTPDNVIHPCKVFDHFSFLENIPEFADDVRKYQETVEENERFIDDDLASMDSDEHPEMHRFFRINDNAKIELTNKVYNAGWSRLGMRLDVRQAAMTREHYLDPAYWIIEAEGTREALVSNRPTLHRISKYLGCKLEFTPAKWGKHGIERDLEII